MMESNRRLFVMLRPLDPMSGHSGYARLELSNGPGPDHRRGTGLYGGRRSGLCPAPRRRQGRHLGKAGVGYPRTGRATALRQPQRHRRAALCVLRHPAVGRELFDRFQISLAAPSAGVAGWITPRPSARFLSSCTRPAAKAPPKRTSPSPRRKRRKPRCRTPPRKMRRQRFPTPPGKAPAAAEGVRVPEEGAASSAEEAASGEEAAQAPAVAATGRRGEGRGPGGGSGGGPV